MKNALQVPTWLSNTNALEQAATAGRERDRDTNEKETVAKKPRGGERARPQRSTAAGSGGGQVPAGDQPQQRDTAMQHPRDDELPPFFSDDDLPPTQAQIRRGGARGDRRGQQEQPRNSRRGDRRGYSTTLSKQEAILITKSSLASPTSTRSPAGVRNASDADSRISTRGTIRRKGCGDNITQHDDRQKRPQIWTSCPIPHPASGRRRTRNRDIRIAEDGIQKLRRGLLHADGFFGDEPSGNPALRDRERERLHDGSSRGSSDGEGRAGDESPLSLGDPGVPFQSLQGQPQPTRTSSSRLAAKPHRSRISFRRSSTS